MGVILCRLGPQSGRWEAMLVQRRYTYAFADFIHGRYHSRAPLRAVAPLLREMTVEELLDVYSLNFAHMWYRVWLTADRPEHFYRKQSRFNAAFLRGDGGAALRAAVLATSGRGALLWEAPKGRRLSAAEADAACAIRELEEETGIAKSAYRLVPGVWRRESFVQGRVLYALSYYVGLAGPELHRERDGAGARARPSLREICRTGEVSQARWFSVEQIRLLDSPGRRLAALVEPALRLAKKFSRGAPLPAPTARLEPAGSPQASPAPSPGASPAPSPPEPRRWLEPRPASPGASEGAWSQVRPRRGARPAQGPGRKPASSSPTKRPRPARSGPLSRPGQARRPPS